MKNNWQIFFKTLAISLGCCIIFLSIGYFYLDFHTKKQVQKNENQIPYSYTPENVGLLFDILDDKTLFYLNFNEKSISVIFADDTKSDTDEIYGYPIDYTVKGKYNLIGDIIDAVGGIELKDEEKLLGFTGVQVSEILKRTVERKKLRQEIISSIFSKIALYGFSREDFLYIIENSETNLTVPDCYYWQDHIMKLSKTIRFIAW